MLPRKALAACLAIHEGQRRKDGLTPYAVHPVSVALWLHDLGYEANEPIVAAALLHDAIEDQPSRISQEEVHKRFGMEVATIVLDLTRVEEMTRDQYIASFARAGSDACLVKVLDRYDNLLSEEGRHPSGFRLYRQEAQRLLDHIAGNPRVEARRQNDSKYDYAMRLATLSLRAQVGAP